MPFVGLDGLTGTISVGPKSRAFFNIGAMPAPEAFSMIGRRVGVFADADAPEKVVITQQPAVGTAAARPDGKITLDLREYDPNGEITFQYQKSVGGVLSLVDAAVDVANARKKAGWGKGAFYKPRTDSDNRIIVRPNGSTRRIFIDNENGYGYGMIASQEGITTGQALGWAVNNNATVPLTDSEGNTFYAKYGEHPDIAVKEDFGLSLYGYYFKPEENEQSPHLMFRRGQTYDADLGSPAQKWIWLRGHSASHPMLIGAYGEGTDPVFANLPFIGRCPRNIVLQDCSGEEALKWDFGATYMVLDGYAAGGVPDSVQVEANPIARSITFRRMKLTDGFEHAPRSGLNNWDRAQNDRTGPNYISAVTEFLMEDCYLDMAGWNEGYHADFVYHDEVSGLYYPQTPSIFSHCIYAQGNYKYAHFRNIIASRGAFSGAQFRSGGIIQGLLLIENNSMFSIGNGENLRNPSDDLGMPYYPGKSNGYALGNANSWSMVDDVVCTMGGFHQYWQLEYYADGTLIPAQPAPSQHLCYGISLQDIWVGLRRVAVVNHEPNRPGLTTSFTGPDTIGPCTNYSPGNGSVSRAFSQAGSLSTAPDNNQQPDPAQYDVQFANWDSSTPDYRVDGISQGILNGTTIAAYENARQGASGLTHYDFHARLRAAPAPWEERREINDWFRGRLGNNVARRTAPKTMQFRPNDWQYTPGFMSYIELDWSADGLDGLPGDVAGDSVDTYGAPFMVWNHTPQNDLVDVTLRKVLMEIPSGILEATGTLTLIGDCRVHPCQAGIFAIPGYAGDDRLSVDAFDGCFINRGAVTGKVDIAARANSDVALVFDEGDFTLASGNSLTIYGGANVGFDGASTTTRTITLAAGSTTSFKPSLRLWAQDHASYYLPKVGAVLSGTNGPIGTVREAQHRIENDFMVILDDIQRVPADNEDLSGDCIRQHDEHQGIQTNYARVDYGEHAPEILFSGIAEFVSGMNGFDDGNTYRLIEPDLPSAVVLGGTLHLDVTALSNATYTLIAADSVSGSFDAVTAAGNGAKDLTISISETAVTVMIEDGDGTVTGGTS